MDIHVTGLRITVDLRLHTLSSKTQNVLHQNSYMYMYVEFSKIRFVGCG